MMRTLYFTRDRKRGQKSTLSWLKSEIEELSEAFKLGDLKAIEEEFADVFAWLASLANIARVDLEEAVLKKYNYLCPKCNSSPCKCTFQ